MAPDRVLAQEFLQAHPAEAAATLEGLAPREVAALLDDTTPELAAAVLSHMGSPAAVECLTHLSPARAAGAVAGLPPDVAALLLRRMEVDARARVLGALPDAVAARLDAVLRYPDGTAGSLMDPRALALPHDVSVREALARVERAARHVSDYVYVVDRAHVLVGVLKLHELILAPRHAAVAAVMRRDVVRLPARASRAAIVAHPGWRDLHALPVVDEAGRFVGSIRYETLRRLEQDLAGRPTTPPAVTTVLALGELWWTAMTRVLAGLSADVTPRPPTRNPGREGGDHDSRG